MLEILEAKDLTPYAAYETPGVTLHAVESMTAGGVQRLCGILLRYGHGDGVCL